VSLLYPYNVGGVFLFRRQLYMKLGGCNPACTGWGSEDNELFVRVRRLGVDWQSIAQPMFHLHHDSAHRDGYGQSESAQRNSSSTSRSTSARWTSASSECSSAPSGWKTSA